MAGTGEKVWHDGHRFRAFRFCPAKRNQPGFLIGNRIRTCISDDVNEAKAVLRKTMAHYWAMPNYQNYWKEAGYLDEMNGAEAAIAAGRTDELLAYLTDRWLADCTLYGPAARVREGVEQWREAGITTPVLVPLSPDGNQMNGLKAVFAAFEPACRSPLRRVLVRFASDAPLEEVGFEHAVRESATAALAA